MPHDIMLYLGAIALGALHAFEPGHGKTIIAAYMIGSHGRTRDGMLLGLIVTFTHTFSVIILGIIARLLSHTYSDTQLHAWLGFSSSILILMVGIWMLFQRLGRHGGQHLHLFGPGHSHDHVGTDHHDHHHHDDHDHDHDHDHPHDHDHGGHGHLHEEAHQHQPAPAAAATRTEREPYNKWNLLFLGISGGLVPCPAAIATLLAAIAAGRVAQGLTLAIFFSLGLGAVMMTIGVALSHAGRLTEQISANQEFGRRMGILSAAVITLLGLYTLWSSLAGMLSA